MADELKIKIELLKAKMEKSEVGSAPHDMYREILKELEAKLPGTGSKIKLHKDEDTTCESCQ